MNHKISIAVIVAIMNYAQIQAQPKTTKAKPIKEQKFKASAQNQFNNKNFFTIRWGGYFTDTVGMVEQVKLLLKNPILVYDKKGVDYKVLEYKISYKRKTQFIDEETQKTVTDYRYVSSRLFKTPLSNVWINNINETLEPKEEIRFDDVIVTDKLGKNILVGALVIKII